MVRCSSEWLHGVAFPIQFHRAPCLCRSGSTAPLWYRFWRGHRVPGSFLAVLAVASSAHEVIAIIRLVFVQLLPVKRAAILLFREGERSTGLLFVLKSCLHPLPTVG